MKTFHELYLEILQQEASAGRNLIEDFNPFQLDCLFHPEKQDPVLQGEIHKELFPLEHSAISKDAEQVMKVIREANKDVYALVAPAFAGQFEGEVSPGKLRAACKALGFKGMIEVAVFADMLTLKEALEFDHNIHSLTDFQLTSCCCPIWISLIRKEFPEMISHVPGSVSPMIAAGRVVKKLRPDTTTIFIGPCIAKKMEAKEEDIADAIDYVLTFEEMKSIFDVARIHPHQLAENEREHSSRAGRIYARTGGVSEAVKTTVEQLSPGRDIALTAKYADGIPACRDLIRGLKEGKIQANFFEGMACKGGCIGGPKNLISSMEGKEAVEEYGNLALYRTPLENPYVMEFLSRLGFGSVEELLEESDLFTRKFA